MSPAVRPGPPTPPEGKVGKEERKRRERERRREEGVYRRGLVEYAKAKVDLDMGKYDLVS